MGAELAGRKQELMAELGGDIAASGKRTERRCVVALRDRLDTGAQRKRWNCWPLTTRSGQAWLLR